MKLWRRSLLCFVLASLFLGCKKEKDDTEYCSSWEENAVIEPQPYLPLYPGSEWTYADNSGTNITKRVSENYVAHWMDKGECRTHTALVPYWDGRPMYGYSYPTYPDHAALGPYLFPLLQDAPTGTEWWYDTPGHVFRRMVTNRDTTITVQGTTYDQVIVIAEGPYIYSFLQWSYYAKDVGLIKEERRIGSDTLSMLELTSYNIVH